MGSSTQRADAESGRFIYANAGHNLPCRRHDGQADELRARGMPLGLMPGTRYEEKEIVLEIGDSALFYSDGIVEAHNPQREMFGFPRLRRLVAEQVEEGSLVDFLMDEVRSFTSEGWEQEDDITLLTLRRSEPRTQRIHSTSLRHYSEVCSLEEQGEADGDE
jgi:serine phosphatase RsbU (regulator of sigma subunit)